MRIQECHGGMGQLVLVRLTILTFISKAHVHTNFSQPCGARSYGKWQDAFKVHNGPAYLGRYLVAEPCLIMASCKARFREYSNVTWASSGFDLPALRVPRDKLPSSERRGSIMKLDVDCGLLLFSETNIC